MTTYSLLSVVIERTPRSPLEQLHFEHVAVTRMDLGEPHTVLAVAHDGTVLAFFYAPVADVLGLLREQRLLPAMLQLRERSPWCYLLLDGTMRPMGNGKTETNGRDATGWSWAAVQGALLSVQEAGISIITLQSTAHLADMIYTIAKRERTTKRVRPPREMLFVTPAEDLLLALPGIGEDRVSEILRFTNGNGAAALDALTDPGCAVPGIGPTTKAEIRLALGLSDGLRLALAPIEPLTKEHTDEHHSTLIAA